MAFSLDKHVIFFLGVLVEGVWISIIFLLILPAGFGTAKSFHLCMALFIARTTVTRSSLHSSYLFILFLHTHITASNLSAQDVPLHLAVSSLVVLGRFGEAREANRQASASFVGAFMPTKIDGCG